jgi:hypothetical protein
MWCKKTACNICNTRNSCVKIIIFIILVLFCLISELGALALSSTKEFSLINQIVASFLPTAVTLFACLLRRNWKIYIRLFFLGGMLLKTPDFWDITPCRLVISDSWTTLVVLSWVKGIAVLWKKRHHDPSKRLCLFTHFLIVYECSICLTMLCSKKQPDKLVLHSSLHNKDQKDA